MAEVNTIPTEPNLMSESYNSPLENVTQLSQDMKAFLLKINKHKELLRNELNKFEAKFADEERKTDSLVRK